MRVFSWDPPFLAHMREFGNLGLHPNVVSSCGWLHTTGVGRMIGLQGGGCHIRHNALSVIKWRKPLTICWFLVFSLGSSGSIYSSTLGSNSSVHSLLIILLICGGKTQALLRCVYKEGIQLSCDPRSLDLVESPQQMCFRWSYSQLRWCFGFCVRGMSTVGYGGGPGTILPGFPSSTSPCSSVACRLPSLGQSPCCHRRVCNFFLRLCGVLYLGSFPFLPS
jgi:hypothetical protein